MMVHEIVNIGSPVVNVKLSIISGLTILTSYIAVLKTSSNDNELRVEIHSNSNNKDFSFKLMFTTKKGIEYEQIFRNQKLSHDANRYAILAQNNPTKVDVVDC